MLGSIAKVGELLDLFTAENPEWGATQVAASLGIAKSSAHELMMSLTHIGLLHRTVTGRYRLGFRALSLYSVLMAHTPWRNIAREEMSRLADTLREPVHLAAFDGGRAICIDKVEGDAPLTDTRVGAMLPAHATALGKVILAYQPPTHLTQIYPAPELEAFTPHTITSRQALELDLRKVRERGYALALEERAMGICSIASAIRNSNGEVIAAISVSLPASRFPHARRHTLEHLQAAADRASSRIGFSAELMSSGDGLRWHVINGKEVLKKAPQKT